MSGRDLIQTVRARLERFRRINFALAFLCPLLIGVITALLVTYRHTSLELRITLTLSSVSLALLFLRGIFHLWQKPSPADAAAIVDRATSAKERFVTLASLTKEASDLFPRSLAAVEAQTVQFTNRFDLTKEVPFTLHRYSKISLWSSPILAALAVFLAVRITHRAPPTMEQLAEGQKQAEVLKELAENLPTLPDSVKDDLRETAESLEEEGITSDVAADQIEELLDKVQELSQQETQQEKEEEAKKNEQREQANEQQQKQEQQQQNEQEQKQSDQQQKESGQENQKEQQAGKDQEKQKQEGSQSEQSPNSETKDGNKSEQKESEKQGEQSEQSGTQGKSGEQQDKQAQNGNQGEGEKQDEKKTTTGVGEGQGNGKNDANQNMGGQSQSGTDDSQAKEGDAKNQSGAQNQQNENVKKGERGNNQQGNQQGTPQPKSGAQGGSQKQSELKQVEQQLEQIQKDMEGKQGEQQSEQQGKGEGKKEQQTETALGNKKNGTEQQEANNHKGKSKKQELATQSLDKQKTPQQNQTGDKHAGTPSEKTPDQNKPEGNDKENPQAEDLSVDKSRRAEKLPEGTSEAQRYGAPGEGDQGPLTSEKDKHTQVAIPLEEKITVNSLGASDNKLYKNKPGSHAKTELGPADFSKVEPDNAKSRQPIPIEYKDLLR